VRKERIRYVTENAMRIGSIADHLDLIETIARWHWGEWGYLDPNGSPEKWATNLEEWTSRDHIPTLYVALRDDELLGSVSLNEHDMNTRRELSPWVSGVYVKPAARGQGVASALVRHAVRQAAEMGIARLYLYTDTARGLYEKLAWHMIDEDHYEGHHVTIMAIDTGTNEMPQRATMPSN
jgi:GNAT superfamily N-acetyltransferase